MWSLSREQERDQRNILDALGELIVNISGRDIPAALGLARFQQDGNLELPHVIPTTFNVDVGSQLHNLIVMAANEIHDDYYQFSSEYPVLAFGMENTDYDPDRNYVYLFAIDPTSMINLDLQQFIVDAVAVIEDYLNSNGTYATVLWDYGSLLYNQQKLYHVY